MTRNDFEKFKMKAENRFFNNPKWEESEEKKGLETDITALFLT